jgi:hypothetical protein
MKKLITITLIALLVISCEDSSNESKISETPPFNEFWLSTNFDIPSKTANSYEKITYYNTWGSTFDEHDSNKYRYYLSNTTIEHPSGTGDLPSGSSLSIKTENNTLVIESSGTIPRQGSAPSDKFKGDINLWSDSYQYIIIVKAIPQNQTITSANLRITSDKFDVSYDITEKMQFTDYSSTNNSNMPEWSISNKDIAPRATLGSFDYFTLAFRINDVYGTTFKK